jgi:sec-independent protein translocase protein TatC
LVDSVDQKKSLVNHLDELRFRLLTIIIFFTIFFVIGFLLSNEIIYQINKDLFPSDLGVKLIVTYPVEFIVMKINIGIFLAMILSIPFVIYQLFVFLKPALTKKERKILLYLVLSGFVLFMIGALFSYFVLLKVIIWFFAGLAKSSGVYNLWDINQFVSFIFLTSISIGLVFQLPLITIALLRLGLIKLDDLKNKRGYVVILIFIFAAIITPPDPLTQIIIAVPMMVLYETSVIVARIFS